MGWRSGVQEAGLASEIKWSECRLGVGIAVRAGGLWSAQTMTGAGAISRVHLGIGLLYCIPIKSIVHAGILDDLHAAHAMCTKCKRHPSEG